jgi:hypothetical protein
MKNRGLWAMGTVLLAVVTLLPVCAALRPGERTVLAQVGGDYDLSWWTVDGGGATFSTGGSYSLGGTIGQPDAGAIAAAVYVLQGGFWPGGEILAAPYQIYLPVIMRNS